MKWVALALIIIAAPLLAIWLRGNPKQAPWVWGSLTFLPFVVGPWNLDAALYSIPTWSGYVKGWELSLLDAVAFGVVFGTRGRWPKLALLIPLSAYILAVAISVIQARFPNYASAYVVQLLRVGLIFLAVARVASMERGERALISGLIVGLTVQAGYALWARAGGALQTGGSLGHQNLLGYVSHMIVMPAFALLLSGRWQKMALLGLVSGAIVVILTASRATIALAAVGVMLTLLLSLTLRFSPRKIGVGFIGILLLLVSLPLALTSLDRRFDAQNTQMTFLEPDQQRIAFSRAARDMIAANPLGVGPNHYVFVSNTEGYSNEAGVNWSFGNRSAHVHNAYLLITAETGYLGGITYIILLFASAYYAFSIALKFRRNPSAELSIGFGVAVIVMAIHNLVEWVAVLQSSQFLFAAILGLIAGLRHRMAAEQVVARSKDQLNKPQETTMIAQPA